MMTIGADVTWQRNSETGEWKATPVEKIYHPTSAEKPGQPGAPDHLPPRYWSRRVYRMCPGSAGPVAGRDQADSLPG